MHADSGSFLKAKKICAEIDKSCNKVELSDHGSKSIYFKVLPRYKYRQEGEKILYGDQIVLYNHKLSLYLHVSEQVVHIDNPITFPNVVPITPDEIDFRM